MVDRNPNVIGTVIMGALYWGMLFYWLRDDLLNGAADEQMRALRTVSYTHLTLPTILIV